MEIKDKSVKVAVIATLIAVTVERASSVIARIAREIRRSKRVPLSRREDF